jgi:hypothetical protein
MQMIDIRTLNRSVQGKTGLIDSSKGSMVPLHCLAVQQTALLYYRSRKKTPAWFADSGKSPGSATHPVFGFLLDIKINDSYTEA